MTDPQPFPSKGRAEPAAFPRRSERAAQLETPRLPLYLTQEETEALLALCAAAPGSGGAAEAPPVAGLGELLRPLWREES